MPKPDFYLVTPRIPRQKPGKTNDIMELAKYVEDLGYDRAWIIETNDRDAFSLATQMSLASKKIQIGTNIVSAFTRTATLLAMATLTVIEVSGPRFVLGLGPGGTEIVRDGHGLDFRKPVTRVRETIEVMRKLLRGERVTYDGYFFKIKNDFRLRVNLGDMKVPIYNSSLNPKMLQMGGEISDGVILSHMPLEAAEDVKAEVEKGCKKAGRDPSEVEICTNLPLGVDDPEAVDNLRKAVAWHLAAPTYDWLISHTSYAATIQELRKNWWSADRERREKGWRLMTDDVLLTFGLGYKPSDIKSRVREYIKAGITPVMDPHGIRKAGHEMEDVKALSKTVIAA